MTSSQGLYHADSLADLNLRTEYEAWLLEAVYEIVKLRLAAREADDFIYPPNGGPPGSVKYGSSDIRIGDWHGQFLKVGAPLVLVTAFKILDMVIEWVLVENDMAPKRKSYSFREKIQALKRPLRFPPLIEARPWLRQRLCALYEQLEPLRGTIIHDRRFTSTNSTLEVSSTKGGVVGPLVLITEADRRNLALALVSVLRCLQGAWVIDAFEEKRLRRALDELAPLHGMPVLGQLPPERLRVQLCVLEADPIEFDLGKVRTDVAAKHPTKDTVFDVLIITVSRGGGAAKAYVIPWDQVQQDQRLFRRSRADLAGYASAVPVDLNVAEAVRELSERAERSESTSDSQA